MMRVLVGTGKAIQTCSELNYEFHSELVMGIVHVILHNYRDTFIGQPHTYLHQKFGVNFAKKKKQGKDALKMSMSEKYHILIS